MRLWHNGPPHSVYSLGSAPIWRPSWLLKAQPNQTLLHQDGEQVDGKQVECRMTDFLGVSEESKKKRRSSLQKGFAMLETLDYCRVRSGNDHLGSDIEKQMLDLALADLAQQTLLREIDEDLEAKRLGSGKESEEDGA